MTGRVYISANRVSVSRPGYDVLGAPRTPDYMAVDSSFPQTIRLLQSGIVYNVSSEVPRTVLYGVTYAIPPIVEVYAYNASIQRSEQVLVAGTPSGQPRSFSDMVIVNMATDRFLFRTVPGTENGYSYIPRDWIFFVYPSS